MILLILVLPRLIALRLPSHGLNWIITEYSHTLALTALAFWLVRSIPYRNLRSKCIAAAIAGYCLSDCIIGAIWYTTRWRGYWLAAGIQLLVLAAMWLTYWLRSYDQPSDSINDDNVYCLRKKPVRVQDFAISLLGCFGPNGAYAICHERIVYLFRHGRLVTIDVSKLDLPAYHVTRGSATDDDTLKSSLGATWKFLGPNCLTILRRFWAEHGQRNEQ